MSEPLDAAVRDYRDPGGTLGRARRFLGTLLEHIATRGELLAVELAEEKHRLIRTLLAVALMIVSAGMVIVFAGVLAIVLAWDTSARELVAWLIPVVFLVIAIGAWFWLRKLVSRKSPLFRDSLRELRQDGQALRK